MRILATAALALVAAATPALAQDGTFQGPRVEVLGGWDRAQTQGVGGSGFVYGGGIGYDLQRGNAVFGAEAEVTGSTLDKCIDGICGKAGRDLYAGARVGIGATPDTLLYGKIGYSNGRGIAYTSSMHAADNLDGVRLGAGVEHSFGKFYTKVEYRYTNYSQHVERHQVLGGIGYRF